MALEHCIPTDVEEVGSVRKVLQFRRVRGVCVIFVVRFLGAFAKLRKATVRFVCLSIHMELLDSYWTDLREICYLRKFRKSVGELQAFFLTDNPNRCFA